VTLLTSFDLHLLGEGTHFQAFDKLGARLIEHNGTHGVAFAVWAPNARAINVVGDFNNWKGATHPLARLAGSGYWETFVPDLQIGTTYKFEITGADGQRVLKSDPCGRYFEIPPKTASIVWDSSHYQWQDGDWMSARPSRDQWKQLPMSVYEVHLGTWQRSPDGTMHS
jgi:1,4-alpha-glucan branching enzyme